MHRQRALSSHDSPFDQGEPFPQGSPKSSNRIHWLELGPGPTHIGTEDQKGGRQLPETSPVCPQVGMLPGKHV